MTQEQKSLGELAERILSAPHKSRRRLVAIAGSPASGKSTLAENLANALSEKGTVSKVVPMDGFHLHNPILIERGLLSRKGAPETFDAAGFKRLVQALAEDETVYYPTFDRQRDIAIACSGVVTADVDTVVLEGNYLLFDEPAWSDLPDCWDVSVMLDVAEPVLEQRLIERWLHYGLDEKQARARAEENDLRNARRILNAKIAADIVISGA